MPSATSTPTPMRLHGGSGPAGVPGEDERDEQRECPDEFADRLDEQHADRESLPGLRAGRPGRHVASPRSAWAASVSCCAMRAASSTSSPSMIAARWRTPLVTVDLRQAEEPADGPAFGVDGLDARQRRDPPLLGEPPGLGVRGLGSDSDRWTRYRQVGMTERWTIATSTLMDQDRHVPRRERESDHQAEHFRADDEHPAVQGPARTSSGRLEGRRGGPAPAERAPVRAVAARCWA